MKSFSNDFASYIKCKQDYIIANIDLFKEDFYQNIFDFYPFFYSKRDVLYFEKSNCFGVFKYDVVRNILQDDKTFSSKHFSQSEHIFLGSDGKDHLVVKKILLNNLNFLKKGYNVEDVKITNDIIRRLFKNAQLYNKTEINAIDWIVNPFTFLVIMDKFGILSEFPEFNPLSEKEDYQSKILKIKEIYDLGNYINDISLRSYDNNLFNFNFQKIFANLLQNKNYSRDEIIRFMTIFLLAGVLTTSGFLASCLYFIQNIEKKFVNNEEYINNFLNEVLRIHSPSQFTFRNATKDVTIDGINIPKDSLIAVSIGSANRDANRFELPNNFSTNRNVKHIAFGVGNHKCIGEMLALDVAKIFIQEIYNNFYINERIILHSDISNRNSIYFHKINKLTLTLNR